MRSNSHQILSSRTVSLRAVGGLAAFALLLSACGGDKADHNALVTALTSQDQMTEEQGICVADAIYDGDEFTEEEIKEAAKTLSDVEGFEEAVSEAIDNCTGS